MSRPGIPPYVLLERLSFLWRTAKLCLDGGNTLGAEVALDEALLMLEQLREAIQ
jgi:hypothetical protein